MVPSGPASHSKTLSASKGSAPRKELRQWRKGLGGENCRHNCVRAPIPSSFHHFVVLCLHLPFAFDLYRKVKTRIPQWWKVCGWDEEKSHSGRVSCLALVCLSAWRCRHAGILSSAVAAVTLVAACVCDPVYQPVHHSDGSDGLKAEAVPRRFQNTSVLSEPIVPHTHVPSWCLFTCELPLLFLRWTQAPPRNKRSSEGGKAQPSYEM